MRTCECGGQMIRHSRDYVKCLRTYKVRLRCKVCKSWFSFHENQESIGREQRRIVPTGRPPIIDDDVNGVPAAHVVPGSVGKRFAAHRPGPINTTTEGYEPMRIEITNSRRTQSA